MKITKQEPKWFELNKNTKFQIRPFPFSVMTSTDVMPLMLEQFKYCLLDWEGVHKEDGKTKLPVNDKNKQLIYDFYQEVREFVLEKVWSFKGPDSEDVKN